MDAGDRTGRKGPGPQRDPTERDPNEGPPNRNVLIRDLLIFQLKLGLDGIKDMILSPLAIGATFLDFFTGPGPDGPRLYKVLRMGERFDLWLNLYDASDRAGRHRGGLYGVSRAGSDTLLGRLEEWSLGHAEDDDESSSTDAR
jgi:hypothetical protein